MGEELVLTEDMNQQIKDKVAKVKMLMEKSRMLKEANAKKREELEAINAENLILEETCNSLEQQNKDVRAKNSENDGKLKFRFNELITAKKKSLRKLGFKVSLTKHPENNGLMKLKVGFLENSEFYAMFDYCTTFEDYDLVSLNPVNPNFGKIQECLRCTKDIQGFLSTLRSKMIQANN